MRPIRHLATAALLAAPWLAAATAPSASASAITLKTAFAAPIAASNALCTAEPRGYVYGTKNYDSSRALTFTSSGLPGFGFYVAPNAPSSLDLVPGTDAGGRADLCAGFTLPPDVEPLLMRDFGNLSASRIQDDPAWPDLAETHVIPPGSGQPAPVGDDARAVTIDLPAGYQAQLTAITPCTTQQFGVGNFTASACPAASQVGEAFLRATGFTTAVFHAPLTGIKLYALDHNPSELARIGLSVKATGSFAPTKLVARVLFAGDGSGRLELVFSDLPRATYDASAIATLGTTWTPGDDIADPADPRIGQPVPTATARQLYLEGLSVRLWGSVASHSALAADVGSWGGACSESLSGTVSARTYADTTSAATAPAFSLSGCSALQLPLTANIATAEHAADTPTAATLTVDLPQPSGTLAPALAHSLRIALPDGLEVGTQFAASAVGAAVCSPAQFGASTVRIGSGCPASSQIGTAQVTTTLSSQPFSGNVYLGKPDASDDDLIAGKTLIAAVFADVVTPGGSTADAPRIKLTGHLSAAADGATFLTFDDLPAIRMSQLRLALTGGPAALLTTPTTCGPHQGSVAAESGGFGPATSAPISLTVDAGCDRPAQASLDLGGATAGSFTLARPVGSAPITGTSVALPPGVLVAENAVGTCDAEGAEAGRCPDASRLGNVRLVAGPTGAVLTGAIYATATPPDGAAAAGVLVAEGSAGGLSLGRIVVPVRFDLRSGDAGVTLAATLPTMVGGFRLDVRSLTVDLDREGAVASPTACGPLTATATVDTPAGAASTNAAAASYASCSARTFQPDFAAQAAATSGGHTRATMLVTARTGDASLRAMSITLPADVSVDAARAAAACTASQFAAAACPAAAHVGTAAEQLSVAADVIGGDLTVVQSPGQPLPAIGVAFTGRFAHRSLGQLSRAADGALVLTLADLPDLPVSRLSVAFDGGAAGLLTTGTAACAAAHGWNAQLVGQNGQSVTRTTRAACTQDAPVKPKVTSPSNLEFSMSAKTGLKLKMNAFGGRRLQAAKLTLPAALRFNTKAIKRSKSVSVVVLGAKAKMTYTGGSLTMTLSGGNATEAVARVRPTAYVAAKPSGKAKPKKQTFRVRLSFADGSTEVRTATAKLP